MFGDGAFGGAEQPGPPARPGGAGSSHPHCQANGETEARDGRRPETQTLEKGRHQAESSSWLQTHGSTGGDDWVAWEGTWAEPF